MTCLVYEDREDKKIRFMRTYFEQTPDKGMTVQQVQLGLMVNKSESNEFSKVKKYRSVMKQNEEGKIYMVGVALRENGRLEFYSDFMLVNE